MLPLLLLPQSHRLSDRGPDPPEPRPKVACVRTPEPTPRPRHAGVRTPLPPKAIKEKISGNAYLVIRPKKRPQPRQDDNPGCLGYESEYPSIAESFCEQTSKGKDKGTSVSEWTTQQWRDYNRIPGSINQQEAAPAAIIAPPAPVIDLESFDAPDAHATRDIAAAEAPDAPAAKCVLVSLDFEKVLDLHFGDSRDFLHQLDEQCPGHLYLDPIQTRATMERELPGIPVVITSGAVGRHGKGRALGELAYERGADCCCIVASLSFALHGCNTTSV